MMNSFGGNGSSEGMAHDDYGLFRVFGHHFFDNLDSIIDQISLSHYQRVLLCVQSMTSEVKGATDRVVFFALKQFG